MSIPDKIKERIHEQVQKDLPALPPSLRLWAVQHLVAPTRLMVDYLSGERSVWLVTSGVGAADANCRVVFDEVADLFGLEFTDADGRHWYEGPSGSFAECVSNL